MIATRESTSKKSARGRCGGLGERKKENASTLDHAVFLLLAIVSELDLFAEGRRTAAGRVCTPLFLFSLATPHFSGIRTLFCPFSFPSFFKIEACVQFKGKEVERDSFSLASFVMCA